MSVCWSVGLSVPSDDFFWRVFFCRPVSLAMVALAPSWQFMTVHVNSWQFMIVSCQFMTLYDCSWQCMTVYDSSWQFMTLLLFIVVLGCTLLHLVAPGCTLWMWVDLGSWKTWGSYLRTWVWNTNHDISLCISKKIHEYCQYYLYLFISQINTTPTM